MKKILNRSTVIFMSNLIFIVTLIFVYYSIYSYKYDVNEVQKLINEDVDSDKRGDLLVEVIAINSKDNIMVAYIKKGEHTYGFAKFEKGLNNRYKIIDLSWSGNNKPIKISGILSKDSKIKYYIIGGHNCVGFDRYGIKIHKKYSNEYEVIQFNVKEKNFVSILSYDEIVDKLSDNIELGEFYYAREELVILDKENKDITSKFTLIGVSMDWVNSINYNYSYEEFYITVCVIALLGLISCLLLKKIRIIRELNKQR